MNLSYALRDNKSPCKDCVPPVRQLGCHSRCPKYISWKKDYDEKKEQVRKEKEKYRRK